MITEREIQFYLEVKDHSVSGEVFKLMENREYGFLETVPQPPQERWSEYYQSEDYISHTGNRRNWFEHGYHLVKSVTLRSKLKCVRRWSGDGNHLLDVGCGTGDFLERAMIKGWSITGIEPHDHARALANQKTNDAVHPPEWLATRHERRFDVITLWHVLEHLPNLEKQLRLFKKLLKPQGTLMIAVPNYKSYDASYYKNFWAAYDVPRHLWHFNKASISKLVERHDMKVVAMKPMWFDAFYVSLLSEKYKFGQMNVVRAIWIGCLSNLNYFKTKEASSFIYVIKNK
ncbi:class I SAM-dependent methyltransferase [Aestuariivivens sediminis]|uniref:class I SAM-dependent methyltransferase n=1 Tax=Aestuariivivens sediminis TaxID=2913557 RepID=UPI0030B84D74